MQVGSQGNLLLFFKSLSVQINLFLLVLRFNMLFIPIQVFFILFMLDLYKSKQLSNTCEMFVASLTRRFVSAKRLFRDL